jgi:hypothetical protein
MGRSSHDVHNDGIDARPEGLWRGEPSFLSRISAATSPNNRHAIFSVISIIGSRQCMQEISQVGS